MFFWFTMPQFEALEQGKLLKTVEPDSDNRYIFSNFKKGKNTFFHNQLLKPIWKKELSFDPSYLMAMFLKAWTKLSKEKKRSFETRGGCFRYFLL